MSKTEYLEGIRKRFEDDLFATDCASCTITDAGELYAECRMTVERKHKNAMGGVMGGAIFTLCDFTFAVASNGLDNPLTTTLSTSITYLSQPKNSELIARASCIKNGKSACCYEIRVEDGIGTPVAIATFNGFKLLTKK